MEVKLFDESFAGEPAPAQPRIHDLHQRSMAAPDNHEVSGATGQPDNHDGRKDVGFGGQHMVERHHDLLGAQSKLHRGFFHGVDRGAVHIGLAGFAQPAIAHGNAEAFEETLQRSRPTVHGGRLDNLGHKQPAAGFHGVCRAGWGVTAAQRRRGGIEGSY